MTSTTRRCRGGAGEGVSTTDRVRGEPFKPVTAQTVDAAIWPAVQQVNRSGWIWTTESCAGHDGRPIPLLGLVTSEPGRAFTLLADALMAHAGPVQRLDPNTPAIRVAFFAPARLPQGRYHFRVVVLDPSGLEVLNDFARRV